MNSFRKMIAFIFAAFAISVAGTPNSMILNDFPLAFDNAWKSYLDGTIEHYSIDSATLKSGGIAEYGKTVFTFNGNKPVSEGNYINSASGILAESKSYYLFDNDNLGYSILSFKRNFTTGKWIVTDSMALRFNSQNRVVSMNLSVWDSTGTKMEPRVMTVYRDVNSRADSATLSVSMTASGLQLVQTAKYAYAYDNLDRYTFRYDTTRTILVGSGQLLATSITRKTFTYSDGLMTVLTKDSLNTGWLSKESLSVAIDMNNQVSSEELFLWNDTTKWVKSLKKVFTYANNKCITESNYGKGTDTSWAFISKTTFFYVDYTGPALPSLDETKNVFLSGSMNKTVKSRLPAIQTNDKRTVYPLTYYTLNGKHSAVPGTSFSTAVQRIIKR